MEEFQIRAHPRHFTGSYEHSAGGDVVENPQWQDDPRLRRDRRAIDVLGRIDSAEALKLLRELAAGTGSPRTVHARAVIARLPASRDP